MKICYRETRFKDRSLYLIETANDIVDEYKEHGYELTLRQLYYQFVSRDIIPNNQKSYDNLGVLINNARLAGLLDWNAIEDRTRYIRNAYHWEDPKAVLVSAAKQFDINKWAGQSEYVEVWVEKDALVGIVGKAAEQYDVPFFSCRGYVSQTEMWGAAQRIMRKLKTEHDHVTIIHLGDHDPSGKDMTRDITERLRMFTTHHGFSEYEIEVRRVALEMEQIQKYSPPPNPAKLTDSRCGRYIAEYGRSSWELDALDPIELEKIINAAVAECLNIDLFNKMVKKENELKARLKQYALDFE